MGIWILGVEVVPAPGYHSLYEDREVKVWVPAAYRTVCDHVWVEPLYRTVCERVWVPEVIQTREIRHHDGRRTIERIVLCPGHFENRDVQQVISPGHFDDVQRQELVCEGHYDVHIERVLVAERHEGAQVLPDLGIRIGR